MKIVEITRTRYVVLMLRMVEMTRDTNRKYYGRVQLVGMADKEVYGRTMGDIIKQIVYIAMGWTNEYKGHFILKLKEPR